MNLKKRILSAVILIAVLSSSVTLAVNEKNEDDVVFEVVDDDLKRKDIEYVIDQISDDNEAMEVVSMVLLDRLANEIPVEPIMDTGNDKRKMEHVIERVGQLRRCDNVLESYNGYLKDIVNSNIVLTEEDIAYLSTLDNFKKASIVAIKSPITNHYNTFNTDGDSSDYVMLDENGKVLLTKLYNSRACYFDTEIDIPSMKELTEEEISELIPMGEFISHNDMKISGYCFPTFGKATPSCEAIETIREVYGDDVVNCIKVFGLPLAYFDAKAFDAALANKNVDVKGLNN